MKDTVSPLWAKIFINGAMKFQNQAIGMNLRITILKVLPKDKKGGGFESRDTVESTPEGGVSPPPLVHLCSSLRVDTNHILGAHTYLEEALALAISE